MTKVIAELGINHNGDLVTGRQLVDVARRANAWGVKFQYRNLSRTHASGRTEIGDEIIFANISRGHLGPDELRELASYARDLGLQVGTSFFHHTDIDDLNGFDFDFYKVPSSELMNFRLIGQLLESGNLVLASTGMSTEGEVEKLSDKFGKRENLSVLHCVSNYPTDPLNARLGYISRLKSLFGARVGYSSHDREWEVCLLALGFGIEFIERHLTLDKSAIGTDHTSSSEPEDFSRLVSLAGAYPQIIEGNERRRMNQGERINRQNLGRSLYLQEPVKRGSLVDEERVVYVSPQVGIGWSDWEELAHLPLAESLDAGAPLLKSHFGLMTTTELSGEVIAWANSNKISLPVRLHDYQRIVKFFQLASYEFHLSYGEVDDLTSFPVGTVGANYSVHLPDYVANDFLLDPFSEESEIRELSYAVFQKVADFSDSLALDSGNSVQVVCSLSNDELSAESFYSAVEELFGSVQRPGVQFTLQWLPPVAWYFGGSIPLRRVNSLEDVSYILASTIPVTMDISHLVMGENCGWFAAKEVFNSLSPAITHLHISGADGLDGEGTSFDFSKASERELLDKLFLAQDFPTQSKVIEVWQGHLDNFSGFRDAIASLHSRYGDG